MVVFLDNPEKYNSSVIFRRLEDEVKNHKIYFTLCLLINFAPFNFQIKNCITLDESLQKMNHEIAVNPKYIHRIRFEPE